MHTSDESISSALSLILPMQASTKLMLMKNSMYQVNSTLWKNLLNPQSDLGQGQY